MGFTFGVTVVVVRLRYSGYAFARTGDVRSMLVACPPTHLRILADFRATRERSENDSRKLLLSDSMLSILAATLRSYFVGLFLK